MTKRPSSMSGQSVQQQTDGAGVPLSTVRLAQSLTVQSLSSGNWSSATATFRVVDHDPSRQRQEGAGNARELSLVDGFVVIRLAEFGGARWPEVLVPVQQVCWMVRA